MVSAGLDHGEGSIGAQLKLGTSGTHHRRLRIDPRTKLMLLVVVNAVVFGSRSPVASLVITIVIAGIAALLIADLGVHTALIFGCLTATFWLLSYAPYVWSNGVTVVCGFVGFWVLRFFLSVTMSMWMIRTVDISEFIESLYAMKIPRWLIIPLAVMFRFFPVIWDELHGIYQALLLRGYYGSKLWLHPVRTVEYIVVPLLSATARIADELAAAAIIRGLGLYRRPTRMQLVGFSVTDVVLLFVIMVIVVLNWWPPQVIVNFVQGV